MSSQPRKKAPSGDQDVPHRRSDDPQPRAKHAHYPRRLDNMDRTPGRRTRPAPAAAAAGPKIRARGTRKRPADTPHASTPRARASVGAAQRSETKRRGPPHRGASCASYRKRIQAQPGALLSVLRRPTSLSTPQTTLRTRALAAPSSSNLLIRPPDQAVHQRIEAKPQNPTNKRADEPMDHERHPRYQPKYPSNLQDRPPYPAPHRASPAETLTEAPSKAGSASIASQQRNARRQRRLCASCGSDPRKGDQHPSEPRLVPAPRRSPHRSQNLSQNLSQSRQARALCICGRAIHKAGSTRCAACHRRQRLANLVVQQASAAKRHPQRGRRKALWLSSAEATLPNPSNRPLTPSALPSRAPSVLLLPSPPPYAAEPLDESSTQHVEAPSEWFLQATRDLKHASTWLRSPRRPYQPQQRWYHG